MTRKNWYKSHTILSAIAGFGVTVAGVGGNAVSDRRAPTQAELLTIGGAYLALQETIRGRLKAKAEIGKPEPEFIEPEPIQYAGGPVEEPDFAAIARLGQPEDPTPSLFELEQGADMDGIDNEEEDLGIDLDKLQGKYRLIAKQSTKLKTSADQSSQLSSADYQDIPAGAEIEIDGWKFPGDRNDHIEVIIDEYSDVNRGRFYVYAAHFELINVLGKPVEIESPTSQVPLIKKHLTPLKLPGYSSTFYLENPIYPGSHFTWAEATKNGDRIPENAAIVDKIIKQSRALDELRSWLGNKPLVITSWYRDPRSNARVGGARNSSHLQGHATDIACPSMSIGQLQAKVLSYWKGGGVGKGAPRGFVHVASDGWYRVWDY